MPKTQSPKTVQIGSFVTIRFSDGLEDTYQLVWPSQANIRENKINRYSPLGSAVLGRCEGEEIEYQSNGKHIIKCRIVEIK